MGIEVCENQGAHPFWGPERGYNRGNFGYLKKVFLSQTTGPNALIFGMTHHWDMEIHVCTNKVPGVINGPTLRGHIFIYIANSLKIFS